MGIKNWIRAWLMGGDDHLGVAPTTHEVENEDDTRFTITKAINGFVITSTKYNNNNTNSLRNSSGVTKKLYVVPQGESVVKGITYLLASERLE
jgi:hypothetical protein